MKAVAQRLLRRSGYVVMRDRPPRDLANPTLAESLAHRFLLQAVLERLEVDCVIDVGAHHGEFAGSLRAMGYGRDILSFEPVAASYAQLAARAGGDPRWRTRRLALGREAGRASIGVAQGTNFSSFLPPTSFSVDRFGTSAVQRQEEVQLARLDALPEAQATRRPLLKIDTQGFDLEVLAGAEGLLDRVVALQVELSVRPLYEGAVPWDEALGTLAQRGLRPAHLSTVARDDDLGILELDCLLVRA